MPANHYVIINNADDRSMHCNVNGTANNKSLSELLEEYVKPAVESDGGAIHFKSFENGTVSVVLKGACSGCPSSTVTLKSGIENLLKQMLPEVHEVIAVAE
jgi:Fe-S cluster biogenesis protein NfuA